MRTLNFIVEGLTIKKDPQCDFSGIVPGTKGYLRAEFKFNYNIDTKTYIDNKILELINS